jgi:hypothetical protein
VQLALAAALQLRQHPSGEIAPAGVHGTRRNVAACTGAVRDARGGKGRLVPLRDGGDPRGAGT